MNPGSLGAASIGGILNNQQGKRQRGEQFTMISGQENEGYEKGAYERTFYLHGDSLKSKANPGSLGTAYIRGIVDNQQSKL